MASNLTIGGGSAHAFNSSGLDSHLRAHYQDKWEEHSGGAVCEIEEDFSDHVVAGRGDENGSIKPPLDTIQEEVDGSMFSFDFIGSDGNDCVYVAVWRQSEETSMDALVWAIKNAVIPSSTVVFLIHIFPETKFIPSPLGKLVISQVNPEQKDNFLAQERGKRSGFLQKFLQVCTDSKVKVDTVLIESDSEAKAVLDLIPILNIRKLVLGTTRSNIKRIKAKKGSGVIDQILQNAPEFCDVKIIAEGKEMLELVVSSTASSPSVSHRTSEWTPKLSLDQLQNSGKENGLSMKLDENQESSSKGLVACGCFKI